MTGTNGAGAHEDVVTCDIPPGVTLELTFGAPAEPSPVIRRGTADAARNIADTILGMHRAARGYGEPNGGDAREGLGEMVARAGVLAARSTLHR